MIRGLMVVLKKDNGMRCSGQVLSIKGVLGARDMRTKKHTEYATAATYSAVIQGAQ